MSSPLRSRRIVFNPHFVLVGLFGHQSAGTHSMDTGFSERRWVGPRSRTSTWLRIFHGHGANDLVNAVRIDPIMLAEAIERDIGLVMAPIV